MSLDTIWLEIYDPQGRCHFYVNQKTGDWCKDKPLKKTSIVAVDPDSIWSVWNDTAQMTLYYHPKTSKWTSHIPLPSCPVVSLPALAKKPSLRKHVTIPTVPLNYQSSEQPYDKYFGSTSSTTFNHACQYYQQPDATSYEDAAPALSSMGSEQLAPSPANVSNQKVKKQNLLLQTAKASIESCCRSKIFPQSLKHPLDISFLQSSYRSTLTNGSGTSPANIRCCPCASSKTQLPKIPSSSPSPPLSPASLSLSPLSLSSTPSALSPLSPSSPFSPTSILSPEWQSNPPIPSTAITGDDIKRNRHESTFEHYATTQFISHKRGFFNRTPIPMGEMSHWVKYPITKPLLKTTSKHHTKDALACFKKIQTIMGDRPRKYHGRSCTCDDVMDIQSILMCGMTKGQHIRDEIYVQLCKQLNRNPSSSSTQKGWELLAVLSSTFPPSYDLASCIIQFVQDHSMENTILYYDANAGGGGNYGDNNNSNNKHTPPSSSSSFASYISLKINGVCELGTRETIPSRAEIQLARMAAFQHQKQQQHEDQMKEKRVNNEIGKTVFGIPLDIIMNQQQQQQQNTTDKNRTLKIPHIVPLLIRTINQLAGHSTEGVFRIPGLADRVTLLKTQIDMDHVSNGGHESPGDKDLDICSGDANVPASLLRLWLRELPDSLIPEDYYEKCIKDASHLDSVISIVDGLPSVNRRILLYTIGFLQGFLSPEVCKHTLMTVDSLAIVFAPSLLRAPVTDDLALALQKVKLEHLFVKTLLLGPNIDMDAQLYG